MIKTFSHKGLEKFFVEGSKKGIQPKHSQRLEDILDLLDSAEEVGDMNFPGSNLHRLKGNKKSCWAVKVSGNWRMTFKFHDGDAMSVDYEDYH